MARSLDLTARPQHASAHLDALWVALLAAPAIGGFKDAFGLAAALVCILPLSTAAFFFAGERLEESARAPLSACLAALAVSVALAVLPHAPASARAAAVILVPMAMLLEVRDLAQPHGADLAWAARRAARASWLILDLFALALLAEALSLAAISPAALTAAKLVVLACAWAVARRARGWRR